MDRLLNKSYFIGSICLLFLTACNGNDDYTYNDKNVYYEELYRPLIHFTPEKYWMNDPNGMVYLDGEYHLYYQYNPQSSFWGNMSWGHAVSTDLIHWKPEEVALTKDNLGDIFSGSAVIDKNNTAGFGTNALVAIYTSAGSLQSQSLAYSLDKGRTFAKYEGNPVIPNDGRPDFRDPKVFWYEKTNSWIMALATEKTISFYGSPDLKEWKKLSEFGGEGIGARGGVWECPDLFTLTYNGQEKWVLLVSLNPGAPNGGSGTQYFIGDFDGEEFTMDNLPYPLWLDYGMDNYAGVTWSNAPNDRKIFIGWMSNWLYAGNVPTHTWRGAMTLPRELSLEGHPDGYPVLISKVVEELDNIAGAWKNAGNSGATYLLDTEEACQVEITLEMGDEAMCTIALTNDADDLFLMEINSRDNYLRTSRSLSGVTDFSSNFISDIHSPLGAAGGVVKLTLYIDQSSVECLINGGMVQQTNLVYPSKIFNAVSLVDKEGEALIKEVKVRTLTSIW